MGKGWARDNELLGQQGPSRPLPRAGPHRQPRPHARRNHMSERLPRIALAVLIVGLAVAQPRDGGAVGRRHPRCGSRCRGGLEGRPARSRARGRARRRAVACRCSSGPTGSPLAYAAFVLVYWLLPQGVARRGGDAPGPALRRAPRSDPRGRLLPRPAARPDPEVLAPHLARARRRRRRGDRMGADRRLPRAAPMVAGLGRSRLVQRPARARLPGYLRAARELDLQHGGREQPDPAPRLGLPQPPCHRLHARRRAALPRRSAPHVVDGDGGHRRVRGTAVDAHPCRLSRARSRPLRARGSPAPLSPRRCSRSHRS